MRPKYERLLSSCCLASSVLGCWGETQFEMEEGDMDFNPGHWDQELLDLGLGEALGTQQSMLLQISGDSPLGWC